MGLVVMRDHFAVLLQAWTQYLLKCQCRIFVDDIVPSELDTLSMYHEPVDDWYAPVPLEYWYPAYVNDQGKGQMDHEYVVWTYYLPAITQPVYGYFITDFFGTLVAAERNPDGRVYLKAPGQTFVCKPRVTLRNDPGDVLKSGRVTL